MLNSRWLPWRSTIHRLEAAPCRWRSTPGRLYRLANSYSSIISSMVASSGGEQDTSYSSSQKEPFLSSASSAASSRIADVTPLAEAMRAEVREYTKRLHNNNNNDDGVAIRLVGIVATTTASNDDNDGEQQQQQQQEQQGNNNDTTGGALVYSEQIAETFAQDGIEYEMHSCIARHPLDVEDVIREMNQRDDVHGILVFYPIFKSPLLATAKPVASISRRRRPAGSETEKQQELEQETATNNSPRFYLNRLTGVRYKTPDDYLRDLVSPAKDVEGLRQNNYNSNNVYNNNSGGGRLLFRARGGQHYDRRFPQQDVYVPCTAQAVTKILATYHTTTHEQQQQQSSTLGKSKRWLGCTATVINRSEICGLPLAALLALEGATVYSVDESSILEFVQQHQQDDESSSIRCNNNAKMRRSNKTLQECLMESSIIVTGVPSQDFTLPTNVIQSGTTVINVSEYPNVDQDALLQRPGIQFIPQIGKVTVAALEQNLIRLHQQQQQQQRKCQHEQ